MRVQALNWMRERIKAGATKDHGVFCISDFQDYLNNELLPKWKVPKNTLPRRAQNVDLTSEFLQVSWSTARSWAIAIGAKFKKHTKGYYVDGHDRADVLEHRSEWLSQELKLELRQYLWIQLTVEQAAGLNIPGCTSTALATPSPSVTLPSMKSSAQKPKRRFATRSVKADVKKMQPDLDPEQKKVNDQMRQHVANELVYQYRTPEGHNMVEVHVDLLPQSVRKRLGKKLKIHGIEVDMGGNLSVRFPAGKDPIIKVGTDEVIFKVTTYTHIGHLYTCMLFMFIK